MTNLLEDVFLQDGINSSKVYCKYCWNNNSDKCSIVLIVAKCIVNDDFVALLENETDVLIVAKCIVNKLTGYSDRSSIASINSSKVYCKYC